MIKFLDRPAGHGKTSDLLTNFEAEKHYFVVVNARSEIDRFLNEACVPFSTPEPREYTDRKGKKRVSLKPHLRELVRDSSNIVISHKLFDEINIREFDLSMYHLIIDEVFNCVQYKSGPKAEDFTKTYIEGGLATVQEDGKVIPTDKWKLQGDEAYKHNLLYDAIIGRLYVASDGFYVSVVPISLFTSARSCLILTYLAKGSLMMMFLRSHGIIPEIDCDEEVDKAARQRAKQLLSITVFDAGIGALGYARQGDLNMKHQRPRLEKLWKRLKSLRCNQLKGVPIDQIMLTCRKDLWFDRNNLPTNFAKSSKLSKARWCHKSTKGTNKFQECTHAVHVYQLNLNPSIAKFLNVDDLKEKEWRQSEMIQWIYRTNIRKEDAGPVELFVADTNAAKSVNDWLNYYD